MNKKNLLLLVLFLSTFAFSCRRQNVSRTPASKADVEAIENFVVQDIDFQYFSSKAKANIKDGSMDQNVNLNIRIKKDEIIWLSVTHPIGIEAARILVTRDSIYMHDKINSKNEAYTFDLINQKFNVELDFQNLQAILVGNLPMPRKDGDILEKDEGEIFYSLKQENGTIMVNNFIRMESMKLEKLDLRDNLSGNTLAVNYEDFGLLNTFAFPYRNTISGNLAVDGGFKNILITIVHNKPEITDKELNFPFNMPN